MTTALMILALSTLPTDTTIYRTCEFIEKNYMYDEKAKLVLTQYLFCKRVNGKEIVLGWVLAGRVHLEDKVRKEVVVGGKFGGQRVVVRAGSFIETWTQYDVERDRRDNWPLEKSRTKLNSIFIGDF
jgi:hypothetical protein